MPSDEKNYVEKLNNFLPFMDSELKCSHYNPSIVFYEPFGGKNGVKTIRKKKNSKVLSVFFTGECVHSSVILSGEKVTVHSHDICEKPYSDNCLDYVDISLGFDYIQSDNYIRYPLWLSYYFPPTKNKDDICKKVEEFNNQSFQKTKFCTLIASHDRTGTRTKLYQPITTIGQINCPGKFMHNDDSLDNEFIHNEYNNDKYEYLKQFKFNLCPENDSYLGYVTEKIFDAFWADCIPIYHGGKGHVEPEVINPDSFIYMNPENPHDAIERINELHTNENAYNAFKKHKKLKDSAVDYIFDTMSTVYDKFEKVILEKNIHIKHNN